MTSHKNIPLGRVELLSWLNGFLETNYQRIEDCADGIAYCQIFDAMFPNVLPLHTLDFNAKYQIDFEKNLKVLQEMFKKKQIPKTVPVTKLAKAKFQDNNEFLQWCYNFIKKNYPGIETSYRAAERRDEARMKSSSKNKKPGVSQQRLPQNQVQMPPSLKSAKTAPNIKVGLHKQMFVKRKHDNDEGYFEVDNSYSDSETIENHYYEEDDQNYYSEGMESDVRWDPSADPRCNPNRKTISFPEQYNARKHSLRLPKQAFGEKKSQQQQAPHPHQMRRSNSEVARRPQYEPITQRDEEGVHEEVEPEEQHVEQEDIEIQYIEDQPQEEPEPVPPSPTTLFIKEFLHQADDELFAAIDSKIIAMIQDNDKYVDQVETVIKERKHYLDQLCKIDAVCQSFIDQEIEVEAATMIQTIIRQY